MTPDHAVQLFDAPRSLAETAARFLAEGWCAGERLLAVARPRHWTLITAYLEQHGCDPLGEAFRERCEFVDAEGLLRRVRPRRRFDAAAAREQLHAAVGRAGNGPLRVYGELVELLAGEGEFDAACTVEDLWNDLLRCRPCRLLCGYLAPHFADPRAASALRSICGKHSSVRTQSADSLGTWLTAVHTRPA